MANVMELLPELESNEMVYVQGLIKEMDDDRAKQFSAVYRARRRDPMLILMTALLGFIGIAGVQRFILSHVGMGIVYLLTLGFCFIGTIVDLINYKTLAFEYNQTEAQQVAMMVNGSK